MMNKFLVFMFCCFLTSDVCVLANHPEKSSEASENLLIWEMIGTEVTNRKQMMTLDPDRSGTPVAIKELIKYKNGKTNAEIKTHILVKRNSESSSERQENLTLSMWQPWSSCDITQCNQNGTQLRQRRCFLNGNESENVNLCQADLRQQRSCTRTCGVEQENFSYWTEWTSWTSCSVSCGLGVQRRQRNCDHSPGGFCPGSPNESKTCQALYSCPSLTPWSGWSACSRTCGNDGYRSRRKDCIQRRIPPHIQQEVIPKAITNENVSQVVNIDLCDENEISLDQQACLEQEMCNFTWSEWSNWGRCTSTCGIGYQTSERTCLSGDCEGEPWRFRDCFNPPCWSQWTDYNACSKSCGTQRGYQVRHRRCLGDDDVNYLFSNESCEGEDFEQRLCNDKPCPSWSRWTRFSVCSKTCDRGIKTRTRLCLKTRCFGRSVQTITCNIQRCPFWSEWSSFTCCSVTCGENGMQERTRSCLYNHYDRDDCPGNATERVPCSRQPCNITLPSVFDSFECGMRNVRNTPALRILGGEETVEHGWPWQASWQDRHCFWCRWVHRCGATLVAPQWLVIASHCIEEGLYRVDPYNPGEWFSVVLGMHRLQGDGQRHFLSRVFVHENYTYETVTEADVALLRLRNPVTFTSEISPVCLPDTTAPTPGQSCHITGWGHTETPSSIGARLSPVLMEAEIPIIDFESCQNLGDLYRTHLKATDHFCAGDPNSTAVDSCQGDSGGPLVCPREDNRYYLSGVTSFGFLECGLPGHHVGIYTPVHLFEQWIRNTIDYFSINSC